MMSEPMPKIEVGDWVRPHYSPMPEEVTVLLSGLDGLRYGVAGVRLTWPVEDIAEIRKANGIVRRRDGGQP